MQNRTVRLCLGIGILLTVFSQAISGQSVPVPEYYGTYAVVDGHLLRLEAKTFHPRTTSVDFATYSTEEGIEAGQPAALAPKSVQVPVFPANLKLVVYENGSPNTDFHLDSLVFVKNMALSQMNRIPQNRIRPSYPVNGWDNSGGDYQTFTGYPKEGFEFRFKPVAGHPDMVVAGLDDPLPPGIYRLFRNNEDSTTATLLGGGTGLVFAVEPVSEGEARECRNLTMSNFIAPSQSKYSACADSSSTNSSGAPLNQPPSPPAGESASISVSSTAACSDYNACMKAGLAGYQSTDWNGSSAAFEAATRLQPTAGVPWFWLGNILLRDGQPHQVGGSLNTGTRRSRLAGRSGSRFAMNGPFSPARGAFCT